MDLSAVLAYKSLFFLNRAKNTTKQAQEGQNCTAITNAARCAITASQTVVPLYAVSRCLADTATNPIVKSTAISVSNSGLQKIATAMTSSTTQSALQGISKITSFLAKLGIVGNLSYAAAKCLDANEKDKTKVFMTAAGNCAGMYLFEYVYSNAVKNLTADSVVKATTSLSNILPKNLNMLKAFKPASILLGIGFVAASLLGCNFGEYVGKKLYIAGSKPLFKSTVPINTASKSIEMME